MNRQGGRHGRSNQSAGTGWSIVIRTAGLCSLVPHQDGWSEDMIVVRQSLRVVLLGSVLAVAAGSRVQAASSADALFSEQNHDFGSVARGAMVRYAFMLTNSVGEP